MKRTILAALVLAALASSAQAQSNVTVYGVLDLGYAKISGKPVVQRENHASRLGFRGAEDLGGGLKAIFNLETQILADTGAQQGALFERQANVGFTGAFGTVIAGRTKNIVDGALGRVEPFKADGVIGKINETMMRVGVSGSRVSNAVTYTTPVMSGFGAALQYVLSEVKDADDGVDLLLTYERNAFSLHAGYERSVHASATAPDASMYTLGAAYKIGNATVSAAYAEGDTKVAARGEFTGYLVGLKYKCGQGEFKAVASRQQQSNNVVTDADTVKQFGVGYDYFLSKRTDLYAYLGRERVAHASSIQLGISHKF